MKIFLMKIFLLISLLIFAGCASKEGTITQKFSGKYIWAEIQPGQWKVVNVDELENGDLIEALNLFQPITEISVTGYKNAEEGASLITNKNEVIANTGKTYEPPAPESTGSKLLGWVTGIAFGIGGISSLAAVVFGFFLQDRRIAGTLFLVGITSVILGAGLLFISSVLAAIPGWMLIVSFVLIVLLIIGLGFGLGMKEGWIISRNQMKTGDDS
jgi:hypothetical protein